MKNGPIGMSVILGIRVGLALMLLHPLAVAAAPVSIQVLHSSPAASATNPNTLYLPLVTNNYMSLAVDSQDRQASLDFFNNFYRAAEGVPSDWTGNPVTCNEGTTSPAFRQAIRLRINYFRAMAGVPGDVGLSDAYNRKAQKAALMMSVNNQLNHTPPPTWICYSADGAQAAGSSNLFLGVYSVDAIDGYMYDPGSGNYFVGHRRWILYPQTEWMGTGDIPPVNGYPAANALWVFDQFGTRPATREEFVAWPPPGYVPYPVVFPRWSFAYGGADFSSTSVSMTLGGNAIAVIPDVVVNGFGENTFVWEPQVPFGTAPLTDLDYTVSIHNVNISGSLRSFVYHVIIFNPGTQVPKADSAAQRQLGTPPRFP
jgi:uncharacterized protein YkwD